MLLTRTGPTALRGRKEIMMKKKKKCYCCTGFLYLLVGIFVSIFCALVIPLLVIDSPASHSSSVLDSPTVSRNGYREVEWMASRVTVLLRYYVHHAGNVGHLLLMTESTDAHLLLQSTPSAASADMLH